MYTYIFRKNFRIEFRPLLTITRLYNSEAKAFNKLERMLSL
jgi:hypothetical protein